MIFVMGSLLDPKAQDFLLFLSEAVNRIDRRHMIICIFGEDAFDQFRLFGLAGNDGIELGCSFKGIESQVSFALLLVKSMTEEAVVRENGANVPVVANCPGRLGKGRQSENDEKESAWHGKKGVLIGYRPKAVLSWMNF